MDLAGVRMKRPCKHEICFVVWACLRRNFRYFTDSLTNLIYAYDFDDGKLSNRRIVVDAIAQGLPEKTFCDGLCIDEAGYIWSARFVGQLMLEYVVGRLLADGEALESSGSRLRAILMPRYTSLPLST